MVELLKDNMEAERSSKNWAGHKDHSCTPAKSSGSAVKNPIIYNEGVPGHGE